MMSLAQHHYISAGYEDTAREEVKDRAGEENEADLTTLPEETARVQNVDDAYATENQEAVENRANVNDAYTTSAAELGEQMGENASGL
jgi:hypothetical protein